MKIVSIVADDYSGKDILHGLNIMGDVFSRQEIDFSIINLSQHFIGSCDHCDTCQQDDYRHCQQVNSAKFNACVDALAAADGMVLASTEYLENATPTLLGLMDRYAYLSQNRSLHAPAQAHLRRKVGTPLIFSERRGGLEAYLAIMNFFTVTQVIVPASHAWIVKSPDSPAVTRNVDGHLLRLAERFAWLVRVTRADTATQED